MSRKYPSMQEELAARKAAGEYGDLSQYEKKFFRNEPDWAKKSREDYERSRRISNNGAGKSRWSLHGDDSSWTEAPSHRETGAGKQKSTVRKQKAPKIPKQKANRQTVAEQARAPRTAPHPMRTGHKKIGCLVLAALFFIVMPLIGAIIAVIGDIVNDFGNNYNYEYEYVDDWSYEATGELDEDSFYSDAEAFIIEQTETPIDNDTLISWYYDGGYYELVEDPAFCDVSDGRLFIWAECSEDDDPAEVAGQWMAVTEEFQSALDEAGYGDVPVGVILMDSDNWKLRMVMIDGVIHFATGDYETLGE